MLRFFIIAGLILVTSGLYLNSFPGGFHYDDFPLLLENPVITGQVFPFELFLNHSWGRPLTLFSFHWDYQLFGENPFFFHLLNVLLHLSAVVLLYAVIRLYFGSEFVGVTTALIFAVHPIQSQAVNYVWSRSVLLMTVFALLCLMLFRRYPIVSLVFFQLAVWSRVEALFLAVPLILLLPRARKFVVAITGINVAILAGNLHINPPGEFAWTHSDPVSFWLAAPQALWQYIGLMAWPSGLTIDHPYLAWSIWPSLAAVLALVILLVSTVAVRRQFPWVFLAVSWVLLCLAPSLVIPNGDLVNESRSYFAFAGFALLLALGIEKLGLIASRRLHIPCWCLLFVVCLVYMPLTFARNSVWRDDASLWEEAVEYSPAELRPRYNWGVSLARAGQRCEARAAFEEALNISPIDDLSYAGLGYCAESRGAEVEALRFYRMALSLNPSNSYARLRADTIGERELYP